MGLFGAPTPEQERSLRTAHKHILGLVDITTNLLDIAKIEAGETELNRTVVDIVSLAKAVCSFFRPPAEIRGLRILEEFPDNGVEINLDIQKIEIVLTNLISNLTPA